ncbi:hypothetical protein Pint_23441 [Pistacia integerrima]|uniref:Uncharacterized protein n=1 Tax=Pistacia integerrima TaxID=434235 RepID=A0ACC0YL82_9ROSI|nr:hypothetical protein Pint_23441 [Pistacia integerrima]
MRRQFGEFGGGWRWRVVMESRRVEVSKWRWRDVEFLQKVAVESGLKGGSAQVELWRWSFAKSCDGVWKWRSGVEVEFDKIK